MKDSYLGRRNVIPQTGNCELLSSRYNHLTKASNSSYENVSDTCKCDVGQFVILTTIKN